MPNRKKQVILIANCLVNPYCRVHILGQNFPLSEELTSYLMSRKVGIIQYICPETTAMGLMRNPQGRQQYDNTFFRTHCKELIKTPMLMVEEFEKNGYKICGYIGVQNSPTCSVNWGKHKVNRYGTESSIPDEVNLSENNSDFLKGIMAEIIEEEASKSNIQMPFFEFPVKSAVGSYERKKFWYDLRKTIEPFNTYLNIENSESFDLKNNPSE